MSGATAHLLARLRRWLALRMLQQRQAHLRMLLDNVQADIEQAQLEHDTVREELRQVSRQLRAAQGLPVLHSTSYGGSA